ncbi:putative zinc finger membrane protein [Tieghemostelium lacteum]|uniref:Palmitoyltransferase n=1 Tax=Tieghemostelium lacteum TaxID=361077 RepID=A0A152A395_TIELA|nr:putative zinc finger membrane protein [Tieghemostelium lacteum]|eukprot:KYR00679.1 putative zinc finger membrane protein [Tieghemostelium lacteum]
MNFLIVFVLCLLSLVVYSQWILIFEPLEFNKNLFGLTYITIFHLDVILLLYSYYKAIVTNPGHPPVEWLPDGKSKEDLNKLVDHYKLNPTLTTRNSNKYYQQQISITGQSPQQQKEHRFCSVCSHFKPHRTYHCRYCNKCILKQDHHCPWIDNCTGFRNQKSFILFLLYTVILGVLASTLLAITGFYILNTNMDLKENKYKRTSSGGGTGEITYRIGDPYVTILYILNFAFIIPSLMGVFGLFYYQLDFLFHNYTSIERFERKSETKVAKRNNLKYHWRYDRGWKKNFREVFGESRLGWFLPIGTPKIDGLTWVTVRLEDLSDQSSDDDDNRGLLGGGSSSGRGDVFNV